MDMRPMSRERWRRLEAALDEALDLDGEARERLLDRIGAEDPSLRHDLERLLHAEASAPPLLEGQALDHADALLRAEREASAPLSASVGRSIGPYRLVREIGRGGMGTVYEAHHRRLRRGVALKFLPPHLADDEHARERFVDEARAAASLDHPNVCTVHDIVESNDGRLYIAMALYEGETLRDRLARGPLRPIEAADIARQIASGLRAAHAKGVIHRDVKPSNVMLLPDGPLKVLDFGLAKLAESVHVTKTGVRMGTVAYMSPEQIRGDEIDHRTDVWSLGALVHEMLTGERAFRGEREWAVLDAILHTDPVPVSSLREDVPRAWDVVVRRALAKDPARRFQDMDAYLDALDHALAEPHATAPVDQSTSVAASTGGARFHPARPDLWEEDEPSIAVLPFADMSPGGDQAYFCDGIAEEILNALARIEGLRVAARSSSFQFKEGSSDVRAVGSHLDVGTVLEGSVRRDRNRLRVTVRLTNVEDGFRLWSERYDREMDDVFAIQDEIAEHAVESLHGVLTEQARSALRMMPKADVRAYDYYLRGRRFFSRQTQRDHEFARQMFARATEVDPAFAHAYAGFSDACVLLYKHFVHDPTYLEEADTASQRAVALQPDLAEAHASRGLFLSLHGDHDAARREFETAIRLGPRHYETHFLYAVHEGCMRGHTEHAAVLYKKAAVIRPDDYQAHFLHAAFRRGLGDTDEARRAYERGLHLARRHLELNPDDVRAIYLSANALVALGERERGLAWADRALTLAVQPSPFLLYNIAAVHALSGDTAAALDYLERALEAGYAERAPIENDPDFHSLHGHTRFAALLRSL